MRASLRSGLLGAIFLASCGGNVTVEPAGSGASDAGGNGGEGGGNGGAGTGAGAGTTGTGVGAGTTGTTGTTGTGGSGGITTTGGVGAGGATCSDNIEAAVAAAPDPIGFGDDPPPSGTYVVAEVAPDMLVIADAQGLGYKYRWVGQSLEVYFQIGDTAFVDVEKGLGNYHVISSPAQAYVATYQGTMAGAPMIAGEAPWKQPDPGFGADCQLAGGPCRIAWEMTVPDGEFVIVPIPIGTGGQTSGFQWHHVLTVSDCDVTSSEVRFTVTGPVQGLE